MAGRIAAQYLATLATTHTAAATASDSRAWARYATTRKRDAERFARRMLRHPPPDDLKGKGATWHAAVHAVLANGQRSLLWQAHRDRATGRIIVEEL